MHTSFFAKYGSFLKREISKIIFPDKFSEFLGKKSQNGCFFRQLLEIFHSISISLLVLFSLQIFTISRWFLFLICGWVIRWLNFRVINSLLFGVTFFEKLKITSEITFQVQSWRKFSWCRKFDWPSRGFWWRHIWNITSWWRHRWLL